MKGSENIRKEVLTLLITSTLFTQTLTLNPNDISPYRNILSEQKNINITIHEEEIVGDRVKEYDDEERKRKEQYKEDLYYLSRIIWSEAGSDWCTDEHQLAVGSVVLNRVKDKNFPNSIKGVISQKGQYTSYNNMYFRGTPNKRTINNAKYLLKHGSQIPKDVVYQSQGVLGSSVWKKIQNQYFCFK